MIYLWHSQWMHIVFLCIALFVHCSGYGGESNEKPVYVKIRNIEVAGNKKSKPEIITRELNFALCDSILAEVLQKELEKNRLQVFNLGLFNRVSFNIKNWEHDSIDVYIHVIEKFRITPIPIIKLADRNLNEWWRTFDHDFSRIQYGGTVVINNIRGMNERLRVTTTFGLGQMLDAYYKFPQVGKHKGVGLSIYGSVYRTRRMPYATENNKLVYYYGDGFVKKNLAFGSKIYYRYSLKTTHTIDVGYSYTWISDEVVSLHPSYFLDSRTQQNYIKMFYDVKVDHRNFVNYPTGGWYFAGGFKSYGLGLQKYTQLFSFYAQGAKFFNFLSNKKMSSGHFAKIYTSLPLRQPYNIQRALGYEKDAIRGFEYSVIDGQHFFLTKHELRYELFKLNVQNTKTIKKIPFAAIPVTVMLKGYVDCGYVKDSYYYALNPMNNKFLLGYGLGIDLVTYGEVYFRIEYSFNNLKQKGLYLHVDMPL